MKIEKLSQNRLQIMLDLDDMITHNIDLYNLQGDVVELNKLIEFILLKAKSNADFDLINGLFVIKAVQSEESIVFTITRIRLSNQEIFKKLLSEPKLQDRLKLVEKTKYLPLFEDAMFVFEDASHLGMLISHIEHFIDENSVIYHYDKKYYLLIRVKIEKITSLLSTSIEFGKIIPDSDFTKQFLGEHGTIIETGIDVIAVSKLF